MNSRRRPAKDVAPSARAPQAESPAMEDEALLQDSLGNAAIAGMMEGSGGYAADDPADLFGEAASGGGGALPYRAEMEAAFGEDFSDVRAHVGKDEELAALGAHGAALGDDVVLESGASRETVAHELTHVVQARRSGGSGAVHPQATVAPASDASEAEAERMGGAVAAGGSVAGEAIGEAGGGLRRRAIHLERDPSNPVGYSGTSETLADPQAAQADLDATPAQKAEQLSRAIGSGDLRSLYQLLGGDNAAVKAEYQSRYGKSVEQDIRDRMPYDQWAHALSYARFGKADLESRVKAVTWDVLGTKEEALYNILETATVEERFAMANDAVILFYIKNDTSGAVRERCLAPLKPLMNQGGLSEEARKVLFEAIKEQEAALGAQVQTLLVRLQARKGFFNDDEDGMLTDVTEWVKARGTGFPDLDVDKGEPSDLMPAIRWLQGELSSRQFTQAVNTLRGGGTRGLMDKIEEAGADTTLFWGDVDEKGIYAAIAAASPEERQAILADPEKLARVTALLDEGAERDRGMRLLRGQGDEGNAKALDELLAELDSWIWISDKNVFAALEKMGSADLVRIRNDEALRKKIEGGIDDVPRFHALIGFSGTSAASSEEGGIGEDERKKRLEGEAAAGSELAADNMRLVARIEQAVSTWDDDEDLVYKATLEWQAAGGKMDLTADRAAMDRINHALSDIDYDRADEIWQALLGTRKLSYKDRLESAAAGLGTDDAGLEGTLKEVPDTELVRGWSNLPEYKAKAESAQSEADVKALASFIPDISQEIKGILQGERWSDWLDKLGELREKLAAALKKPEIASIVKAEFHYVPSDEVLARLQYAQARAFADQDRGPEFWNRVSMGIMDSFDHTGVATEQKFGEYRGAATDAVQAQDGSAEEGQKLAEAEKARQEYLASHKEYGAAKASASAIAGAIVGVVVSTLVTIASAGTAGPACAALMGSLAGAAFTELTEKAVSGNAYDAEKGAEDLTVALVTGLMTLGTGAVVDKLAAGAAATAKVKAVESALKARFGDTFARYAGAVGKETLSAALSEFPTSYAEDLMRTEGLLRQELGGAGGALKKTAQGYALNIVTKGVQHAVNDRTEALKALKTEGMWDEYADELVKKKMIDLAIASVAAQVASGKAPTPDSLVKLLCKVAETRHGATLDVRDAREDAGKTLDFFNTASVEELKKVKFIGDKIAARIVAAREAAGTAGFRSIRDVLDVPYVRDDLLTPAAIEIRDEFLKLKQAQTQVVGVASGT